MMMGLLGVGGWPKNVTVVCFEKVNLFSLAIVPNSNPNDSLRLRTIKRCEAQRVCGTHLKSEEEGVMDGT